MIIDISIENFLSIKEKVTLSLEGSTSKRLEKNYFNIDEKEKLLKSIAIYGANASGKSNIIKGFFNMLSMIISSGNFKPSQTIPFTPFLLDENLNETTKFEINLIIDEIKYNYFFSYNNNEIVEESLYYWPNKTKALIFKRNGSEFKFNVDKAEQERLSKLTLENNLFLSKSAQLNYNKTRILYEYFFNNFIINIHSGWENFTIKQISENEQLKKRILEILKSADFGGIVDIKVKKERKKVNDFELIITDEKPEFKQSEIERDVFDVKIVHLNEKNERVNFPLSSESTGTIKTLQILGPLLDILDNGKVLFIDELELNLHPEISKFIVKMFNSNKNKNAQLIFTTHDTNLLDNDLLRKDQIYFTNKKPNKFTELDSLFDYNIRENMDFEKAYLNGRVGGIPFIDFKNSD